MPSEKRFATLRQLVLTHGRNTTCYQTLNPALQHWCAPPADACVAYIDCGGYLVAAGEPVAAPSRLAATARQFERFAAQKGKRVCWFAAEHPFLVLLEQSAGHAVLSVGVQPVWHPQKWLANASSLAVLRQQIRRAINKGVTVSQWGSQRAVSNAELHGCLQAWLETKGLPPMGFLVDPFTLGRLGDRCLLVAERDGRILGFTTLVPVPRRNGWLVEQTVRVPDAVNGTGELLAHRAAEFCARQRSDFFTLGLAPLSKRWAPVSNQASLAVRLTLGLARVHCQRFFDFKGLERYKAKFRPDRWEPVAMVVNQPRVGLPALWAVAAAFSNGRPFALAVRALARALTSNRAVCTV